MWPEHTEVKQHQHIRQCFFHLFAHFGDTLDLRLWDLCHVNICTALQHFQKKKVGGGALIA